MDRKTFIRTAAGVVGAAVVGMPAVIEWDYMPGMGGQAFKVQLGEDRGNPGIYERLKDGPVTYQPLTQEELEAALSAFYLGAETGIGILIDQKVEY